MKKEVKIIKYYANNTGVVIELDNKNAKSFFKCEIADLFITFGGSFTKALGQALLLADPINTLKILTVWERTVTEYLENFILNKK